jgi:hypothetical protein
MRISGEQCCCNMQVEDGGTGEQRRGCLGEVMLSRSNTEGCVCTCSHAAALTHAVPHMQMQECAAFRRGGVGRSGFHGLYAWRLPQRTAQEVF